MEHGYSRPQLRRPDWTSLNGRWKFQFDDECRFRRPADTFVWPHTIEVPFPPESAASGIADTGYHFACWDERDFEISPSEKHVVLHFSAVDYSAWVWVNGKLVVTHEGGHTPFCADITFALNEGTKQTVTVLAKDDPLDLTKSRATHTSLKCAR